MPLRRSLVAFACLAAPLGIAAASPGLAANPPNRFDAPAWDAELRAIPTYESVGLYWTAPPRRADCRVRFRKAGEPEWREGLDLWYDERNSECRGSLVGLEPGMRYEAQLSQGRDEPKRIGFETWKNARPVARVVKVPSNWRTLDITEGGSPAGYVVYEGAGAVLDGRDVATYNVMVRASYVVVRGFKLKGAKQDAIRIWGNVTDVIVEDNDISGWGRARENTPWGHDMDSAIRAVCHSCPALERLTLQRNRIHSPRHGANSWSDGHPAGPQGITVSYCGGNHVIRHNEITGAEGKRFNDLIGGEDNFTTTGFPNADSDIYGNLLTLGWDDGIEAEGGSRNVRIWGNYIDRAGTGIAVTPTTVGPIYLFRNVFDRNEFFEKIPTPDQDSRQPFFKAGSDPVLGAGRRYIFHNTMLQAVDPGAKMPLGGVAGIGGTGPEQPIHNTWSRNNIFQLTRPIGPIYGIGRDNRFENDIFSGTAPDMSKVRGIVAEPAYARGHGWRARAEGKFQLAPSSRGFDEGRRIPNFNDAFHGKAPDIGAHEAGTAPMKFGIKASPGPAASR